MTRTETPYHHGSHRRLLPTIEDPPAGQARIDAIIVPTVRQPAYLKEAAKLASFLSCPLVTLHSGAYTSARAAARQLPPSLDLIAIDVPDRAHLRLPELATSALLAKTVFARRTDVSAKRNLGLVLSHLVGWERIVFLDDDILIPDPGQVRPAAALLDAYNVVGLGNDGYPDNSVVCHAFRQAGGKQETFIGSGALAAEVKRNHSFFPHVYNEDWFYMLAAEQGLQPLATAGKVIQRPYDPFRTPGRARAEELGDVLAEGTFWLLDQGKSVSDADLPHWRDFLRKRRSFIECVLRMVSRAAIEPGERARMVAALKAARGRLALIEPELCLSYLQAWLTDQEEWQRHIKDLPTGLQRQDALRSLTRTDRPQLTWSAISGTATQKLVAGGPGRSLVGSGAGPRSPAR